MASQTRSGVTFGMLISASTRLSCVIEARLLCVVKTVEGLDVTLDDPTGLYKWILIGGLM